MQRTTRLAELRPRSASAILALIIHEERNETSLRELVAKGGEGFFGRRIHRLSERESRSLTEPWWFRSRRSWPLVNKSG